MDFILIFIVFIMILMFVMMFILPSIGSKRTQKRMQLALNTMAEKYNASVTRFTIMGDSIIGLDEDKNLVLFYKLIDNNEISNVVDLNEMRDCKIVNEKKTIKSKTENFNKLERLGLQFIATDKSKSDVILEFYHAKDRLQLNFDIKTLEQWSDLLSMRLK
ncbi:MAG: hypothetical protein VB102_04785 [Paludibacter sp.]|nr:hypothetical protein [Paludibacter sp.]